MGTADQFVAIVGILPILIGVSLGLELGLNNLAFEREWYKRFLGGIGLKEPIALGVAWLICVRADLDIFSVLLTPAGSQAESTGFGVFLTAAFVAGGKALTMFREIGRLRESAR